MNTKLEEIRTKYKKDAWILKNVLAMARKKLQRFEEIQTFPFYFETGYFTLQQHPFPLKGKWRNDFSAMIIH